MLNIWLIGAGPMAALHAAVLSDMGHSVMIVATSPTRAAPLAEKHGMSMFTEGLGAALSSLPLPDAAIVVLPVDALAPATLELVQAGVPRILVEKPACLNAAELERVVAQAEERSVSVFVGYNRRFFASADEARSRIAASGRNVLSMAIEFTENAPRIAALPTPDHIKQRWVLANSSHVLDLAFHLAGAPSEMTTRVAGGFDWHRAGSDFRGMGVTTGGTNFSYAADWRGPGRWGIELVLPNERLILRPMEQLQVIPAGQFNTVDVLLDDALDQKFKPGLYRQMDAFLNHAEHPLLPTARQQLQAIRSIYSPIANYEEETD